MIANNHAAWTCFNKACLYVLKFPNQAMSVPSISCREPKQKDKCVNYNCDIENIRSRAQVHFESYILR